MIHKEKIAAYKYGDEDESGRIDFGEFRLVYTSHFTLPEHA